jgi:hypothetical protein
MVYLMCKISKFVLKVFGAFFLIAVTSPIFTGAALAQQTCDPLSIDSDSDGTADCADGCPNDSFNIIPPQPCGCGFVLIDLNSDGVDECIESCHIDLNLPGAGFCTCPLYELILQLSGITDSPCAPSFAEGKTVITQPPGVVVMPEPDGTSTVQLFFQDFDGVFMKVRSTSRATSAGPETSAAVRTKKVKLQLRYEAVISSDTTGKVVAKRIAKRNSLAVKGIFPGSYSAKYRVLGINRQKKIAVKTKFSPTKQFVVPG